MSNIQVTPSREEILAMYGRVKLLEARWRGMSGELPRRHRDLERLELIADVLQWTLDGNPAFLAVIDILTEKAQKEDEGGVPYELREKP